MQQAGKLPRACRGLRPLAQLLTVVEEGPEQRGEEGCSRRQDRDECRLEDLVAIEGEIPQEPASSSCQQSAQLTLWSSHIAVIICCASLQ